MNNPQTVDRTSVGRIAVEIGALALVVVVVIVVVLGGAKSGPPSAAGLATATATTLESGQAPSPSAAGSDEPSSATASDAEPSAARSPSPKPTRKPTPKPTVRPTATPNTKPAIASYQIPSTVDCGGFPDTIQIQITWVVRRATGVTISIDGSGIYDSYPGSSGLATVPFACGAGDTKHTYKLTTTGGSGPAAHVTKTVTRTN